MIKHIKLQPNDDRLLLNLIDATEKEHFLRTIAAHEKECVLEENWLDETPENKDQHDYYKSLKTNHDRHIYATAIGHSYAKHLLHSPISIAVDAYGLDYFNTFFQNYQFSY
jgi:hypothetical protein